MKRIRKSRATRFLSWLLTVAMVSPLASGIIGPRTAGAQAAAPTTSAQTVIVIDFTNKSGALGDTLARFATDAVANELASSARFEYIKRDEVIRQAQELGLKPPYDQIAKTKLAQALGAQAIVEGSVERLNEDTRGGQRTEQVGLSVRVEEATSGDLLSGAAQYGEAHSRPGQTDRDSLIFEATTNAAVLAVRQILSYNLPEGTILSTVGSPPNTRVLINRGSRDGVQEGMDLIVTRERQRVGRIKIASVFPTDSEATISDNNLGIRPEDKVRAVFPMPAFTNAGRIVNPKVRTGNGNALSSAGKVLMVLLVGVVLAEAVKGGNTSVTGVTAEPDTVNQAPAVQLVWRDNFFGNGAQTLQYHIWRFGSTSVAFNFPFNPTGIPIAALSGGQRQYTDRPQPYTYWDGINTFLQPGNSTGSNNNNQNTITVVTPTAISGIPQIGITYIYQLTAVIQRPVPVTSTSGNNGGGNGTGNGTNGGFQQMETDPVNSGPATPLTQPIINTPMAGATNVPLAAVNITWQSVAGADLFAVDISTDRTFTNRNLIIHREVFSTAPLTNGVLQSLAIDLSNDPTLKKDPTFANFVNRVPGAPRPTIFFRVGARNDSDRPGPVNALSHNHGDTDRTFRFIYSLPQSFQPADMPPPPP